MNTHVANVSRPAVSSRTSIAHDRIRIVASDKVDNKLCNLFRYETLHRQCARSTELHPMRLRFVHPATGSSRDLFFTRRGALRTVYAIGAIGDAITAVRTSRAHRNNKFNKHAEYYIF